ncbi:hypothetical protein AC1031_018670 [Aphanomyces cochlioides]|nr:hypothetical protein AC1031_018670 [Aphanomyces cochlioides]
MKRSSDDGMSPPSNALIPYRRPSSYWEHRVHSVYIVNPLYMSPNSFLLRAISDPCLLNVLAFLDGQSLNAVSEVCRALHDLANDDNLWLHLCRVEWNVSPEQLAQKVSGRDLYRFAQHQMERVMQDIREAHLVQTWHLPTHTLNSLTRSLFS